MSGDRPGALELLRTARAALLDDLLPALPHELHYTARMIANAIDIAAREIERGSDPNAALTEQLFNDLYGGGELPAATEPDERRRTIERRLADDLRGGVLDAGCQQAVRELLRRRIVERLRISNPRYLERAGIDPDRDTGEPGR